MGFNIWNSMIFFSTIAKSIQTVVNQKADELAVATHFISRRRKITGANFIKTLVFGWLQNHTPSVEGLARAGFSHDLKISAQGLDKRFTKTACWFVKSVLEAAVGVVIAPQEKLQAPVFEHFKAIYVHDCSTINLPCELLDIWQGVGGDASGAALKLDASLELRTGAVDIELLHGRDADNRSPHAQTRYEKGTLRLQDLGYFNLARMKEQSDNGEFWISRLQPRTRVYQDNQAINLVSWLENCARQQMTKTQLQVELGSQEKLAVRLFAWQLPEERVAQRRRKLTQAAQKKGRAANSESLALAAWNIVITNVPADKLTINDGFLLYSLRWQIELLFKLWKTYAKVGHSQSANPYRILCEIYAKLLGVVISHWLVLAGLWLIPQRSLVKGFQMIREQSVRLADCLNDLELLTRLLTELGERFKTGCSLNSRKKHPNACQQLSKGYTFS